MGFWTSTLGWVEEATKGVSKLGIPGVSQAAGLFSFWSDRLKDAEIDFKFGELSANIGDLRNGLDGANAKIESQGKALQGQIDGVKSELEGAIKQQGEKFDKEIKNLDAKIATATGQMKKDLEKERTDRKNEMAKQKQELESQINEVTNQLNQAKEELQKELADFKNDVKQKFEEQEHKIRENQKRIEAEKRAREQEIKEVKDKISQANTKINNLQQEKDELQEDFQKYQHATQRKMEEIHQDFEDYQAETDSKIKVQEVKYQQDLEEAKEEFETKSKEVDAKIKDNQEILTEHEEDLANVKHEQKKQNILNEELFENIQETNDILFAQQRKLNLVSQQMDDIQEEVHLRMDKISKEVNQKTEQTLNIAKDATKKVDRLTKDVQQMRDDLENIEDQIKQNKEETEKVKQQAKQTNQRIDNLLKAQALSDFSQEQSNLDKIQKSLSLKAEEAKLIATLNLLKETKNLVHLQANKEWLVGIKQGTETEVKGSEGMLLDPNSSWAKKYTKEQLQEWGWDTRLFGEHEKAQLLSEDQDKKESQQEKVQAEEQEGEEVPMTEQAQQVLEEVNKVQSEILQKLSTIQEEIASNVQEVESAPPPSTPPPKPSATTAIDVIKADSKVKIAKKALERQKQAEKEAKQRAAAQPTKQNQKQVEEEIKETKKSEQALQQAQEELSSLEKKQEFEEALEEKEKEIEENQSEEINLQWQQIQALSQQALQENPDHEKPEETKEEDLNKKLEEIVQQLQEQEVTQAASQKSMTYFMLYLIIFLMEYVVYKKNGLPGLIVLNIILLICYWYKDQIMEYWDLIGPYLLIIGYVAGNVLAYNSVDNPDYKMPMVYGFNAVVGLVYAYTYWQRLGGKQLAANTYQEQIDKLRQEFKVNAEEWEQIRAKKPEPKTWTEKASQTVSQSNYNIYSDDFTKQTQELNNFQVFIQQREEAIKKEEEMTKQAETLQKAAKMEQQLKDNLEKVKEDLKEPPASWQLIREKYPEFTGEIFFNELKKAESLIKDIEENKEKGTTAKKSLLNRLTKLPTPSAEEQTLLSHLQLTLEQYIAISLKTPYLSWEEKDWLTNNYLSLTQLAKFQLLNAGLNALEINTYDKKEKLVQLLITCHGERELFGLTVKEKENILRFMMNTLNLTKEQQGKLEDMGIKPYNATEWTITEEQKDHLLDFGLNKLTLTEEQAEQLAVIHSDQFKTFSLTGQQKNILNSLAPLIREDKYSLEALELLKSLHLKPNTNTFLVGEEIIPDPNTSFGAVKSNYLPLKEKFLKGEQKTLRKIKETKEKALQEEEIKQNKLSILRSLMEFANNQENQSLNLNLTLDNWVKKGVFKEWQKDLLLTLGFKTIPKYNFFELLIFAVKNFETEPIADNQEEQEQLKSQQLEEIITQILTILDTWRDNGTGKKKEAVKKAIKQLSNESLPEEQKYNRMTLLLNSYPNDDKKLNSLIESWKDLHSPIITGSLALYLENNPSLKASYQEWINSCKNQEITINKEIWEKFVSSRSPQQRKVIKELDLENLAQQVSNILGSWIPPKSEKEEIITQETSEPIQPSSSTSSKYDDLLTNLEREERERQCKKLEREETRRKLEEAELTRRQSKLSEKDRKLKEDQERRQKEKELAEQEEKKREESRLAREQALREEQENFLNTQLKNFEEKQKQREENYNNQVKEAEIVEKKKQTAIEELERQNKFNQEQLEKDKKLAKEELTKKLEQAKTEDEAEKQKILKQHQERMTTLEKEKLENDRLLQTKKLREEEELTKLKEKNRNDLAETQNKLDADRLKAEEEFNKLKEEYKLRKQREEDAKKEREQDELRGQQRRKDFAVTKLRDKAWEELMNYSLGYDEVKHDTELDGKAVEYKFVESRSLGGYLMMPTLKEIFNHYPGVKVSLRGVENLSKKRVNDRPMTYDDIKNVKKLADRFLGLFTKEEWKKKIDQLDDENLLE